MMRHFALSTVFALVATLSAQPPQDDQAKVQELKRSVARLSEQILDERAKLLLNIKVNDVPLDPKIVKREAVYLTGGKLVEAKVADFFIFEEVKKQVDEHKKPAEYYTITDDEVLREIEPMMNEFSVKNPGIDFWEVVRTQFGLDRETFLQQKKQAMLFDKVFFPGAPNDWPPITQEAIKANTQGGQGPEFMQKLQEATKGVDDKGNARRLPEFWVQLMRQFVQKGLRNWSEIKYASNGLHSEAVISVNGIEWSTDEAFEFVRKGLFVQDLERALQEVVVREALRQELVKMGAYVSDEEFQKRYEEYRKPYDDTPFTVEVIATRFKGYPCLEAFRARWRLITSYSDTIKADMNDDAKLQAHADKYAAFFADGSVNLDLIPFQARNPKTGAWEPDGMQKAKERCDAIFAKLKNKELKFDEALAKYGEFFSNDEKKGLLGNVPLNQIKQQLRESEFTELLDGYSIASFLFYDAQVGKTYGPIQGPDGWFIARINSRTPAQRKLDVKVPRERELVTEDYLNHRFTEWANDVIARVKVE
jgi:hypothetical protein